MLADCRKNGRPVFPAFFHFQPLFPTEKVNFFGIFFLDRLEAVYIHNWKQFALILYSNILEKLMKKNCARFVWWKRTVSLLYWYLMHYVIFPCHCCFRITKFFFLQLWYHMPCLELWAHCHGWFCWSLDPMKSFSCSTLKHLNMKLYFISFVTN